MSVLVLGDGEGRAVKILYGMTILATIVIGIGSKLLVMRVLMTIRASRKLHFVDRIFAGRRVTFVASDGSMFSLERIF